MTSCSLLGGIRHFGATLVGIQTILWTGGPSVWDLILDMGVPLFCNFHTDLAPIKLLYIT
jgi:hypothetical protein